MCITFSQFIFITYYYTFLFYFFKHEIEVNVLFFIDKKYIYSIL